MARVLIVDDEPAIREMLREALEHAGHSVDEAGDGAAALAATAESAFDLVIMDVVMPGKGGLETLMELRRRLPLVRVILMTGTARIDADPFRNLADRLGVVGVFEKPLSIERVLAAVNEIARPSA